MSIILDALRKSERERQSGQVPGMSAVVSETALARPRWISWIVGILALVNVAGVAYWLYRGDLSPVQKPSQTQREADKAAVSHNEPVTQAPSLAPSLQAPVADTRPPMAPVEVMPIPAPILQPPATSMPEHLMPPANPTRAASDNDDSVDRELEAEEGAKNEALSLQAPVGAGLPMINDMPEAFRSRIPSFRITMFAYSENPQDRFVIINMKKLVAGDVLPGGVLLIEIRAENLVGELDGQKFLIPRF